jgi:hypothetical protein
VDAKVVAAKIEAAVASIVRLFIMSLLVCEGCTLASGVFGPSDPGVTPPGDYFL